MFDKLVKRAKSAPGRNKASLSVIEIFNFVMFHVIAFTVFPIFDRERMSTLIILNNYKISNKFLDFLNYEKFYLEPSLSLLLKSIHAGY